MHKVNLMTGPEPFKAHPESDHSQTQGFQNVSKAAQGMPGLSYYAIGTIGSEHTVRRVEVVARRVVASCSYVELEDSLIRHSLAHTIASHAIILTLTIKYLSTLLFVWSKGEFFSRGDFILWGMN